MKMEIDISMKVSNEKKLEYPFSNRPKDGELLNVSGGIHWLMIEKNRENINHAHAFRPFWTCRMAIK